MWINFEFFEMLELENNLKELIKFENWQLLLSLGIIPAIALTVTADILKSDTSFAMIWFPQPCNRMKLIYM